MDEIEKSLRSARCLAGLALAAWIGGCTAGSGEGLDVGGRPLSEGGDVPLAPTLASIQANVFNPSCIICHAGAAAPLGLRLDAGNSFTNLVGVRSRQDGSVARVSPGDPDRSYLIMKLEGTASEGETMPLGGPPIPQATIDFIRQWIADGALPESGGPGDAAPVVVSLAPSANSISQQMPAEIAIGFDQDIDASTVNDMTVILIRSGGDGLFGDVADVPVQATSVALSAVNPQLVVMDLTGAEAVEDRYQLTLEGSGANVILGVNGLALDGEFGAALPSGDGVEGGDFVASFDVQGLQPTLASIQANVFTPTCATAGCHTGPSGSTLPAGMDLTSENASSANLIGVSSIQVPSVPRVDAGNANNSYLIQKLEGTAAQGGRMPQGGPFLDQADIDVIRQWINDGATR